MRIFLVVNRITRAASHTEAVLFDVVGAFEIGQEKALGRQAAGTTSVF